MKTLRFRKCLFKRGYIEIVFKKLSVSIKFRFKTFFFINSLINVPKVNNLLHSTSPSLPIGSNLINYNNQLSENSKFWAFFFWLFFFLKKRKRSSQSYADTSYNYFCRGFYLLSGPFCAGLMLLLP